MELIIRSIEEIKRGVRLILQLGVQARMEMGKSYSSFFSGDYVVRKIKAHPSGL